MGSSVLEEWKVHGTKKGALPISLEKRPCGKKVTIITNVTNPVALLQELKGRYQCHSHRPAFTPACQAFADSSSSQ